MKRAILVSYFLLATCAVCGAPVQKPTDGILGVQLSDLAPRLVRAPLPSALERIGLAVQRGHVLFGVEVMQRDSAEPTATANLSPKITVEQALRQVLSGAGYDFRAVSPHLIEVFPRGADRDPQDLMNLRVARFDVSGVQAGSILSRPGDFIPRLRSKLTLRTGMRGGTLGSIMTDVGPPPITLHLRNVTVRQILDAVSEATENRTKPYAPLSWLYTFNPTPGLSPDAAHVWRAIYTVPADRHRRSH